MGHQIGIAVGQALIGLQPRNQLTMFGVTTGFRGRDPLIQRLSGIRFKIGDHLRSSGIRIGHGRSPS